MPRLQFLLASFVVLVPLILGHTAQADWLDKLRRGGYVIVLRHGATNLDTSSADPMSNPNRKTIVERQLSEEGRAQARSIGKALRELKIPVSDVITSQLQRAVDTGRLLGFDDIRINTDLAEAGSAASPEENNRRVDALRKLVGSLPPANNNLVIVTHKPNLVDAFGKDWSNVREGEASVFEPGLTGGYTLVARIQASEWNRLVKASSDLDEEQTAEHCRQRPFSPGYD